MSFLPSYEKRGEEPEKFLGECKSYYSSLKDIALWIMEDLNYHTMTYGRKEVAGCVYGVPVRNRIRFEHFHPILKRILGLPKDGDVVKTILEDREGSFHKIYDASQKIREEAQKLGAEVDQP